MKNLADFCRAADEPDLYDETACLFDGEGGDAPAADQVRLNALAVLLVDLDRHAGDRDLQGTDLAVSLFRYMRALQAAYTLGLRAGRGDPASPAA